MEFFTLQTFYTFTKSVTYLLIAASLISFVGFWAFLTERDDDNDND